MSKLISGKEACIAYLNGVMVGHCVSYDKDSEKSMDEVLDYLLDLGYIKPQDKRVVELYYDSNDFDLKRYVNK